MKIKTLAKAIGSVRETHTKVKGRDYVVFRADCGSFDGRRVRISGGTRQLCENAVRAWYEKNKTYGDGAVKLSAKQLADASYAFHLLEESGVARDLSAIVADYLKKNDGANCSKRILEAYDEYMATLQPQQKAEAEFRRQRVGRFVATMPTKRVSDVRYEDVARYLNAIDTPSSWNFAMTYIKTFFNWCMKKPRCYCLANPLEDISKKPIASRLREYMAIDEVEKYMRYLEGIGDDRRDYFLLRATLAFFCGIRHDEIDRVGIDDIRLAEDTIIIREPKGFQHGASHRSFKLMPNAHSWLASIDLKAAYAYKEKKSNKHLQNTEGDLHSRSGVKFVKNGARHSFITYHIALDNDPSRTAGMVGNSVGVIKSHYEGIGATHADGERYFAILPHRAA